jgi:hypothetical protein
MTNIGITPLIRKHQESIVYTFIAASLVFIIGFVIIERIWPDITWINFVWIPIYGLCFALIGFVIEIDRLNWVLFNKEKEISALYWKLTGDKSGEE